MVFRVSGLGLGFMIHILCLGNYSSERYRTSISGFIWFISVAWGFRGVGPFAKEGRPMSFSVPQLTQRSSEQHIQVGAA